MSEYLGIEQIKDGDLVLTECYSQEGRLVYISRSKVSINNSTGLGLLTLFHEINDDGVHSMSDLYLDAISETKFAIFEHPSFEPGGQPWGKYWKFKKDTNQVPAKYSYS